MQTPKSWDLDYCVVLMDKLGIDKSTVSITFPGMNLIHDDRELAIVVTRSNNLSSSDLKP